MFCDVFADFGARVTVVGDECDGVGVVELVIFRKVHRFG